MIIMSRLNVMIATIIFVCSAQASDAGLVTTYSPQPGAIYEEVDGNTPTGRSINYQYRLDDSKKGLSFYYPSLNIQGCMPKYPQELQREGIEGEVEVRISLDKDGIPETGAIIESSGHEALDNAALTTAVHCKYPPKISNGEAVPVTFKRKIVFTLSRKR